MPPRRYRMSSLILCLSSRSPNVTINTLSVKASSEITKQKRRWLTTNNKQTSLIVVIETVSTLQ